MEHGIWRMHPGFVVKDGPVFPMSEPMDAAPARRSFGVFESAPQTRLNQGVSRFTFGPIIFCPALGTRSLTYPRFIFLSKISRC
jgi:hypothetical protein